MSIKSEYKDACSNNNYLFYNKTGIQRADFDRLLRVFSIGIPKDFSMEERLFAILYAKNNVPDAKRMGELLNYSKSNWAKYGREFVAKATTALASAEATLAPAPPQHIPPPILRIASSQAILPPITQMTLPPKLTESQKKGRNKTTFDMNVTISLANDNNSPLDQQRIIEHAQRRVDLFFYLLIAYYKTGLTAHIADTLEQHGCGKKQTPACHSALLPRLWDTEHDEPRYKPNTIKRQTGLLDNTHLYQSMNSTVELHEAVNYFETHHLEGKKSESKMREKSLFVLNQVSQGNLTPIEGMLQFLMLLNAHFTSRESCYLNQVVLKTSPKASRALILSCEKKGSFKETWHENVGFDSPTLNDNYVNTILKLTEKDKNSLKKQSHETNKAYIERFHEDQATIHERCYASIRREMNLPATVSQLGIFARPIQHSTPIDSADTRLLAP